MTTRLSILLFVLLSLFALWYCSVAPPRGDELHYLVTAHSIAYDHDLFIENNYANGDYRKYFPGEIDKHSVVGRGGHEYLYHGLGLFPVILAPFYFLGGREAVVVFLVFLYILLLREIYKMTESHLILLFAFTLPLFIFSVLIFPEIIAALFFIKIIHSLNKPGLKEWIMLSLLPWMHLRFLPPTIVLFVIMMIISKRKNLLKISIPLISIISYFCFHFIVYESFSPTAPYTKLGIQTGGANILENIILSFTDAQYGLFFVSPIYIFAFAGMLAAGLKKKIIMLPILILTVYSLFVFRYYDWHGGYAPPARYLTAFLPLFIPYTLIILKRAKLWQKIVFILFSIWSIFVVVSTVLSNNYGFLFLDGQIPSLNLLSQIIRVNVRDIFPAFYPSGDFSILHFIWFFMAIAFCAILAKRYE